MKLDQHPDFFTDDDDNEGTNVTATATTDSANATAPTATEIPYLGTTTDGPKNPPPAGYDEPEPKPRHRMRKFLIWFCLLLIAALGTAFYFRYISPYATDIRANGTVYNVERRGIIFKTFECSMATTGALADTVHPYSRTDFSIADDAIAHKLQEAQLQGTPVTITYSRYFGTLPWRGAYRNVITAVAPR